MKSQPNAVLKVLAWIALALVLLAPFYKFIGAAALGGMFWGAGSLVKWGEDRSREDYRKKHENDVVSRESVARAIREENERAASRTDALLALGALAVVVLGAGVLVVRSRRQRPGTDPVARADSKSP